MEIDALNKGEMSRLVGESQTKLRDRIQTTFATLSEARRKLVALAEYFTFS
jgi:hypothetical protein